MGTIAYVVCGCLILYQFLTLSAISFQVGVTNLNNKHEDHAARIARFAIDAVRVAQNTAIHPNKPKMGTVKIRVGK